MSVVFPVVETVEKYTLKWKPSEFWKESTNPGPSWQPEKEPIQYTCRFRGNTLIDITPRDQSKGYPLYERDYLKQPVAPMKCVTRFVPSMLLVW